jgi:hypothetical protein
MNLLLKITKHFTVKNIFLGLIIILVGALLKFIVIPKLLALFNVTLTEIMGYIVASFIALIIKLGIKDLVEELVDKLMPYLFMDTNSPHESGNESANEKPLNKGKTKTLVFVTGNDALDQHRALSNRIHQLMSMINLLTDEEKLELQSLLEIARSHTNISRESDSYLASSNSSVSPNSHSSND